MRCTFCATGKGGFARNLQPHEIVDQVLAIQEDFGKRVSNVGAQSLRADTLFWLFLDIRELAMCFGA